MSKWSFAAVLALLAAASFVASGEWQKDPDWKSFLSLHRGLL